MSLRAIAVVAAVLLLPCALAAQTVRPAHGTVIVVGGGAMGPEIYQAFIKAAGGPDALIVDVPTAGGQATYPADWSGTRGWLRAGARHVVVLHTTDRKLADSDSFAMVLQHAGGVWFEGGRQFHLVDSYAGTKTETAFHDVLARGGAVGGSSAGASILGSFLVRGAPSNNNLIMDDPHYETGFGFLRGVGIDQHVVARERLADLADSIVPKYPNLLAISEDEGTAWVITGDTARIIGRNKAFVYNSGISDPARPYVMLHPGDSYNLATRRPIHRAIDQSAISEAFVDTLLRKYVDPGAGGATVLVALDGSVLVNKSYGIPEQPKYMPTTTVPQFALGDISAVFTALCEQLPALPARTSAAAGTTAPRGGGRPDAPSTTTPLQNCVTRRVSTPIGMHKTSATAGGEVWSDVDELYRLSLGLEVPGTFVRDTAGGVHTPFDPGAGWTPDNLHHARWFSAFAAAAGRRAAFVRVPERHATVIILTNDASFAASATADQILDRLLADH
jgi:cyanophycinase